MEGDPSWSWGRSPHRDEARSESLERERASEGRMCSERGTLDAIQKGKSERELSGQHSLTVPRQTAKPSPSAVVEHEAGAVKESLKVRASV